MLIDPERMEFLNEKLKQFRQKFQERSSESNSDLYLGKQTVSCSQISNFNITGIAGNHRILMDEPKTSAGDDLGPTPVQLLLLSYAGCMEITWLELCSIHNLTVEKILVEITATTDRRFILGGKNAPSARLLSIDVLFKFATLEPMDKFKSLLEKLEKNCPVGASLHPDIKKSFKFEQLNVK